MIQHDLEGPASAADLEDADSESTRGSSIHREPGIRIQREFFDSVCLARSGRSSIQSEPKEGSSIQRGSSSDDPGAQCWSVYGKNVIKYIVTSASQQCGRGGGGLGK